MRISLYAVPNKWLLVKAHRVIPHVVAIATGHRYWISFDIRIVMVRYNRFTSWRYKYSSSLLIVSSSPLLLIMYRLGEYPFGFDGVLIGFDLTFVMSVSKSSDFRIINIAAFRLVLSVLVSDNRLRLRASLIIDDVCLYRFAGTSLILGLIMWPPKEYLPEYILSALHIKSYRPSPSQ